MYAIRSYYAGEKAEEMGAEIGMFVPGAEQRQQRQGGGQRPDPFAFQGAAPLQDADAGEQADRAENGRGGPDRAMSAVVDPGVGEVASYNFV